MTPSFAATLGAAVVLALTTPFAAASSPDAWDAFRADVRAKCLAAAKGELTRIRVRVDLFGSNSYGLALVSGARRDAPGVSVTRICVVPKGMHKSGKAELGDDTDSYK